LTIGSCLRGMVSRIGLTLIEPRHPLSPRVTSDVDLQLQARPPHRLTVNAENLSE
jgi:hypothetical protein